MFLLCKKLLGCHFLGLENEGGYSTRTARHHVQQTPKRKNESSPRKRSRSKKRPVPNTMLSIYTHAHTQSPRTQFERCWIYGWGWNAHRGKTTFFLKQLCGCRRLMRFSRARSGTFAFSEKTMALRPQLFIFRSWPFVIDCSLC